MLPFMYGGVKELSVGAYVFVPNIREAVKSGEVKAAAYYVFDGKVHEITLSLPSELTSDERPDNPRRLSYQLLRKVTLL